MRTRLENDTGVNGLFAPVPSSDDSGRLIFSLFLKKWKSCRPLIAVQSELCIQFCTVALGTAVASAVASRARKLRLMLSTCGRLESWPLLHRRCGTFDVLTVILEHNNRMFVSDGLWTGSGARPGSHQARSGPDIKSRPQTLVPANNLHLDGGALGFVRNDPPKQE